MLEYIFPHVAVDLGTVNTLLAMRGRGLVLCEPSAVALSLPSERPLAAGAEALSMVGRTPAEIRVAYPLRDGVVTDTYLCEQMLRCFLAMALPTWRRIFGVRMMLCLPHCVTEVEREAIAEAARQAGAQRVEIMEEAVAAAIGAGLPVHEAIGSMIVDVGGGTTDAAVLTLGGVASACSVRAGGVHMDMAIIDYIDKEYGVVIGERTAEDVKHRIGSAASEGTTHMQIRGRNKRTGLPESLLLTEGEIAAAIKPVLQEIAAAAVKTLAEASPELCGDVYTRGIVLAGGGARLKGLPELINKETGMGVRVAKDPLSCVALGALRSLCGEGDYPEREGKGKKAALSQ